MNLALTVKRILRGTNGEVINMAITTTADVVINTDGKHGPTVTATHGDMDRNLPLTKYNEVIVENVAGKTIHRQLFPKGEEEVKVGEVNILTALENLVLSTAYSTGSLELDHGRINRAIEAMSPNELELHKIRALLRATLHTGNIAAKSPTDLFNLAPSTGMEELGVLCTHDALRATLSGIKVSTELDPAMYSKVKHMVAPVDNEDDYIKISDGVDIYFMHGCWFYYKSDNEQEIIDYIIEQEAGIDDTFIADLAFIDTL